MVNNVKNNNTYIPKVKFETKLPLTKVMSSRDTCSYVIPDLLGGSPRRCRRDAQQGCQRCWQHQTENSPVKHSPKTVKTPKKSPKKATPKKSPKSKKVLFAEKTRIRKIPPRDKRVPGGIAWAEPVTDLQAECISSVMGTYGIWDREDLEKAKNLSPDERRLITTCIRILEGDVPSSPYRREVLAYSAKRERMGSVYRRQVMTRENK